MEIRYFGALQIVVVRRRIGISGCELAIICPSEPRFGKGIGVRTLPLSIPVSNGYQSLLSV